MATQSKHSISLDGDVSAAALKACEPQNENRPFANLCEEALREYLAPRGYLPETKDEEERQILTTLAVAMKKAPKIKSDLRKLTAKAVRAGYVEAAAAGAK